MASDLKKQVESKRKANASPESEKPQPRLRRRGSLPDLHELTECANPKLMFPDLLRKSFMDPEIMQEVSPCLVKQIQPIIEKTIQSAIEKSLSSSITVAVDMALHKFKSEVMDPIIKQKDAQIESLKSSINSRDHRIKNLETEVSNLARGLNDLEQYGRRQSIRLNNVPLPNESDCEKVVLDVINRTLPDEEKITPIDIIRCHPLGKPNRFNNRQIIIRFSSYKVKAKVYAARFNLSNVFMSEDFTSKNQQLINELISLKKAKRINKFWSIDGKIFAKAQESQPKTRINTRDDIVNMMKSASNEI